LHPELAYEESLAMQQLTHERLAARKVAVRLDPHRANGLPLAARDLLFDPFVQVGIRLLDPRVLRRLRAREDVVGIRVHELDLCRPAARALSPALAQRPLPRGVDVGMTERCDDVRAQVQWGGL